MDSRKLVNNPLFRRQTPLGSEMVEVDMAKRSITWNRPNQIGYFVYQYAKLRMLDFFYNCIQKYVDKADYSLCQMDTDSIYMSLSGDSLESVLRPETRKEFFENYNTWFPSPACDKHMQDFVDVKTSKHEWSPECTDCLARKVYDRRTPGLFKLEWSGEGCVALTSKTYVCFGGNQGFKETKVASKGLSTSLNQLTKDMYLNVLVTKKPGGGINRGFRPINHKIMTYEQFRDALPYLYIKRKVCADGVSTTPLDI